MCALIQISPMRFASHELCLSIPLRTKPKCKVSHLLFYCWKPSAINGSGSSSALSACWSGFIVLVSICHN